MHGPKSVLCTQLLPLECAQCLSPSPPTRPSSSSTSFATQIHDPTTSQDHFHDPRHQQHPNTSTSLPTNFSGASTTVESAPESPVIERHELFVSGDKTTDPVKRFKFGSAQGDTCASCSLVVPEDITRKIPDGAPGSLKADGKTKNGSPVLRSRELVCLGSGDHSAPTEEPRLSTSHNSRDTSDTASALRSCGSLYATCHDHLLTYLTSRSPDDPDHFSALRASVIRTLSRELLPAGMSDGPLCFGDPTSGYTIAYVFRLPDPKARGRRRLYAFVALAGNDASRAFRACPLVWEAFAKMAKSIEARALEAQEEEQKRKDAERQETGNSQNYTPVSSFLAHRTIDPEGNPRKAGQIAARSLADIVGNDRIFSEIHSCFVALLHHLGALYGGLPLSDTSAVCQTTVQEAGLGLQETPQRVHVEILKVADMDKLRDEDATPRPKSIDATNTSVANPSTTQCAPIAIDQPSQRQVVV